MFSFKNLAALRYISLVLSAFFILAHRPDGEPIYLNAEQIDFITRSDPKMDDHRAGSLVLIYGIKITVKEKPEEIKKSIDKVLKQEGTE